MDICVLSQHTSDRILCYALAYDDPHYLQRFGKYHFQLTPSLVVVWLNYGVSRYWNNVIIGAFLFLSFYDVVLEYSTDFNTDNELDKNLVLIYVMTCLGLVSCSYSNFINPI